MVTPQKKTVCSKGLGLFVIVVIFLLGGWELGIRERDSEEKYVNNDENKENSWKLLKHNGKNKK